MSNNKIDNNIDLIDLLNSRFVFIKVPVKSLDNVENTIKFIQKYLDSKLFYRIDKDNKIVYLAYTYKRKTIPPLNDLDYEILDVYHYALDRAKKFDYTNDMDILVLPSVFYEDIKPYLREALP